MKDEPAGEEELDVEASPAPVEWSAERRASEPFVFRSGGPFGSGKKVHTIGAAVEYVDRHPDDGIYHLQNGTLAKWLEDQEAHDLAQLARQVATAGFTDPRVMLETFLLGTGLVSRPSLLLRPTEMRMGYILAGQSCSHDLQIRKGRGRGYLFGKLHRAVPWLSLDPTAFSGSSTTINVSVDTHTLPISGILQEAPIAVESSASEQPVVVPVSFRVMGMPSRSDRLLLRPLVNLLVAGLIGAGLGWLLALSTGGWPRWLRGDQLAPAPIIFAAVIGALWALLGGIRGVLAPLAWPLLYTLGRWLLRTLIWGVTLVVMAGAALWLWQRLHIELGLRAVPVWGSILIGAFALAVLPGIVGELWLTRGARDPSSVSRRMPVLRPGLMIAGAVVVCALLVTGVRFAAPVLQKYDAKTTLVPAQEWTRDQMSRLETMLNHAIDQVYLRMYDRRAPAQPTPAASPQPTPAASPKPEPTSTAP
jgi:hypothetical protein